MARHNTYTRSSGAYSSRDKFRLKKYSADLAGLDYIIKITAMNRVSIPYNWDNGEITASL